MDYTVLFNNAPFKNVIDVQTKRINLVFEHGKYYDRIFNITIDDSDFEDIQLSLTSTFTEWVHETIIIKKDTEEYTGRIKEIRINRDIEKQKRIVTLAGLIERKEK